MNPPSPTQPPQVELPLLHGLSDFTSGHLTSHETYEGIRINSADLSHHDLAGITFHESEISDCATHETNLRSARFIESRIERLDAPSFSAPRMMMRDVHIDASRFGSFEAYDSSLTRVEFTNSKLGWLNLRASVARDVIFRNCTFDEISLRGAEMLKVSFIDCTANRIDVAGAKLQHVDLRGLEARGFDGVADLKGATFSSYQITLLAEVFAAHLGIVVEN